MLDLTTLRARTLQIAEDLALPGSADARLARYRAGLQRLQDEALRAQAVVAVSGRES